MERHLNIFVLRVNLNTMDYLRYSYTTNLYCTLSSYGLKICLISMIAVNSSD